MENHNDANSGPKRSELRFIFHQKMQKQSNLKSIILQKNPENLNRVLNLTPRTLIELQF